MPSPVSAKGAQKSSALLTSVALLLVCLAFPRLAFAQNATTIGTLTVTPTMDNIGVKLTYTGDANSNNSATLQFRQQGSSTWLDAHTAVVTPVGISWPDRRATGSNGHSNAANQNQYRASIVGLTAGATYEYQLTLSDADGVTGTNPVTGIVTLLSTSTLAPQSGSTFYLNIGGGGSNIGTQANPFTSWASAMSGTTCGATLVVQATSTAINSQTFNKGCGASNWYQISCESLTPTAFAQTNADSPNGGSFAFAVTGNAGLRVTGCRIGAGTHTAVELSSAPKNIWFDGNVWVNNNTAEGNGSCLNYYDAAVRVDNGAGNITWTNNQFNLSGNHTACTDHSASGGGRVVMFISSSAGRYIFTGNTLTGLNGGWSDCIGETPEDQTSILNDSDFGNNTVVSGSCNDDALQLEASDINMRIWGNSVTVSSTGLSCFAKQANFYGPSYFYRNYCQTATNQGVAVKNGGSEVTIWFHNTIKNTQTGGIHCWASSGEGVINWLTSRNNICQTNQGSMMDTAGANASMNYDVYYPGAGATAIASYGGSSYTNLTGGSSFCSAQGQECQSVTGNPSLDGSLHISNTSLAYNAGVSIPNFNDAASCWPAQNGAPDIGAYEVNGVVGPACSGVAPPPTTAGTISQHLLRLKVKR